jgi:hypothetical protein
MGRPIRNAANSVEYAADLFAQIATAVLENRVRFILETDDAGSLLPPKSGPWKLPVRVGVEILAPAVYVEQPVEEVTEVVSEGQPAAEDQPPQEPSA